MKIVIWKAPRMLRRVLRSLFKIKTEEKKLY